MRPPSSALHPKSRFTSSLFATTVFLSFFVVALPHILPCPAPRTSYLDDGTTPSNTNPRRRRRKVVIVDQVDAETVPPGEDHGKRDADSSEEFKWDATAKREKSKRACPVPKPGGLMGEILGFNNSKLNSNMNTEEAEDGSETTCPLPTPNEMLGFKKAFPTSTRSNLRNEKGIDPRKVDEEGVKPP